MKNSLKISLLVPLALIVAINFFSSTTKVFAIVQPKGIEITEVMNDSSNKLVWVEIKNQKTENIDITGFSISAENKNYLYPVSPNSPFVIPAKKIFIVTNNIEKFKQITKKEDLVVIQVENLTLSTSGKVEIRDSFDVLIDSFVYQNNEQSFNSGYSLEKSIKDDKIIPSIERNGTPGETYNLEIKREELVDNNSYTEFKMTDFEIQDITADQATVVWTTAVPTIGKVFFGKNEADLSQVVSEEKPFIFHSITLKNLSANTMYFLQISSARDGKEERAEIMGEFKTQDKLISANTSFEEQLFDESNLAKYDEYDALFLKIDHDKLSKVASLTEKEADLTVQKNLGDPEVETGTPFEGLKATSILVLIFISFFLAKYFLRLKNRLKYNLN